MKECNCKAQVRIAGLNWPTYKQCSREAVKDGFCKQHHPDIKKKRDDAAMKEYEKKMEERRVQFAAPLLLNALQKFLEAGVGNSTDFRVQADAYNLAQKAIAATKC